MKTVKITVETKKGESKETTWGVWQNTPCPDIEGHSGRLQWRNGGGVFGEYGRPAAGLGASFSAVLLRDGYTEETAEGNRADYAGFVPYQKTEETPGAIVYRGRSLGETSAEIQPGTFAEVLFRVRGYDRATGAEAAFLAAQVAPVLLAFAKDNARDLKADAITELCTRMAARVKETRESLDKCEAEACAAIAAL